MHLRDIPRGQQNSAEMALGGDGVLFCGGIFIGNGDICMKNDILTREDRLIFTQTKHDRTDRAFLVVIACLIAILVIKQLVIWFSR